MRTFKVILSQLFKAITLDKSYPDYRIKPHLYSFKSDKNGNCNYNHLKTLINYLNLNN